MSDTPSEILDLEKQEQPEQYLKYDESPWYTHVPFVSSKAAPPPKITLEDAPLISEAAAGFWSRLTFAWLTPLLALGYARPLEAADLPKLQDSRKAAHIGDLIVNSFERRRQVADLYNKRLESGDVSAGWRKVWWTLTGDRANREKQWRTRDGQKRPSLILAMNDSVKWWFWTAGLLKITADTTQILSPLLIGALVDFASDSYDAHQSGTSIPPLGKGVGLAFALFFLSLVSSVCQHHAYYRLTTTGVLLRGGLIAAIYSRSLRLSHRARATLTNSKLITHVGTDVSRIDWAAGYFHIAWTAPVQLIICLILLLRTLGPSALAGFSVFLFGVPVQSWLMHRQFGVRQKSVQWTDRRIKLIQELLGGMRVIKFFAWQAPFWKRLSEYRNREIKYIRTLILIRSVNNAVAYSFPVVASVLSFIVYSITGHTMTSSIIFTALTLFSLLKTPLLLLLVTLGGITDAYNATSRLYHAFEAETLTETRVIDPELKVAVEVKGASFAWDTSPPADDSTGKNKRRKGKRGGRRFRRSKPHSVHNSEHRDSADWQPFRMHNINLNIPRGKLVAIVGPVGSGKSSLLQGMIGEMRRTAGSVKFGGSVSYCPQSAWIQNATIRENICFGKPFEADRYWKAVHASCLEADFAMLPDGDNTMVGEKGISLSGGQKQRVNICRAVYCDADVQIFDDPLSALDAHVGKDVFHNVLHAHTSGKTRLLVTHALHFLPQTDYIVTMADGRIAERGTYAELVSNKTGAFSKLLQEFQQVEQEKDESEDEDEIEEVQAHTEEAAKVQQKSSGNSSSMQDEERETGAVSGDVYKMYMKAGRGKLLLPLILVLLVLVQGANIMSTYWLIYWQEEKWDRPSSFYIGIYSGIGAFQGIAFFTMGCCYALLSYFASRELHRTAVQRIMHAPMSFFDTTPLGRVMNRFSKDLDTIDNYLSDSWNQTGSTTGTILGAVLLISIIFPWFLIPVSFSFVYYYFISTFFRASARELKRLDSILRSSLYAHFSESLSGLATIRAYGESDRFRIDNDNRVDYENRAYWLTVVNQRWLGIRLDVAGISLTLFVALLSVFTRFNITPNQSGIALTYILLIQQSFSVLVRQGASMEMYMNCVERIGHYIEGIEQEAPHEIEDQKPAQPWPQSGRVEFNNIQLAYRPGAPLVLKGVDMHVAGGEKIGIIGRTGAGKSSIMVALYRLVELAAGSIKIDGVDIAKLGLNDLRKAMSIIPQDAVLFAGTLRSNIDPHGEHDDAALWDALRRSYLIEEAPAEPSVPDAGKTLEEINPSATRFTLDTVIEDEGANLSLGQRSLVSLARALVKNSKILVLDEATASVDYHVDKKIQETISREFRDRTLLCIAHRLHTIIGYDRICVMDAGRIAELDTPKNLYLQGGVFKSMCDESAISLDDIEIAAASRDQNHLQ